MKRKAKLQTLVTFNTQCSMLDNFLRDNKAKHNLDYNLLCCDVGFMLGHHVPVDLRIFVAIYIIYKN